jgi:hypothetical protein
VKANYEAAASGSASSSSSPADEQCAVVTVTHTEKVTATVTAGQSMPPPSSTDASPAKSSAAAPAYSAPASSTSSSSAAAAPIETSSAPAYSAPAYSTPVSSKPVTTAALSSSSASPSDVLTVSAYGGEKQATSDVSSAAAYSTASSTLSAAASTSTSKSSKSTSSASGKRGLAYNDASLTTCFSGSREISWAYNWGSSSDGLSTTDYTFVPTLWGTASTYTSSWSANAQAAIDSGSTHLFSFNEPDLPAQANLDVAAAATAYAQYMNPFHGAAQLCAPAVTNGGGDSMGLAYLKDFLAACSDCQIDCLNIHWYDSAENAAYFKSHVEEAISLADGKPLFISEFGASGSDAQISSFLEEVMPWMDANSGIAGYAYYMVADANLVTGSEPSAFGNTYMSYTS